MTDADLVLRQAKSDQATRILAALERWLSAGPSPRQITIRGVRGDFRVWFSEDHDEHLVDRASLVDALSQVPCE